jgi:hypothetical protein
MQEVGGAVQRVDQPAVLAILAVDGPRFLQKKAESRSRAPELLTQDLLRAPIGGADEVPRARDRDLQAQSLARST